MTTQLIQWNISSLHHSRVCRRFKKFLSFSGATWCNPRKKKKWHDICM